MFFRICSTLKMHTLICGEPCTDILEKRPFIVNDNMYNVIKAEPRVLCEDDCEVGYYFGKLYEKSDYKKIDEHVNDCAQTGIMDMVLLKIHQEKRKRDEKEDEDEEHILWEGETFGGDVVPKGDTFRFMIKRARSTASSCQ